ncbi:hypothetical protein GGI12_001890 [Dipsacomyces acuminosporus]|nr:hypothetical protein GGI12_001890 [Dipsacomyces acuminosporus]
MKAVVPSVAALAATFIQIHGYKLSGINDLPCTKQIDGSEQVTKYFRTSSFGVTCQDISKANESGYAWVKTNNNCYIRSSYVTPEDNDAPISDIRECQEESASAE